MPDTKIQVLTSHLKEEVENMRKKIIKRQGPPHLKNDLMLTRIQFLSIRSWGSCHLIISLFFMKLEVKPLTEGEKVEG